MEDHVLLKDVIVLECHVASLEHVDPKKGHLAQQELSERLEVRPVAEAARRDGDELATRLEELDRERDEGRVEIARLDAGRAEHRPLAGVAVDLPVGGVEDRCVEARPLSSAEESRIEHADRRLDEVPLRDVRVEPDAGLVCLFAAVAKHAP